MGVERTKKNFVAENGEPAIDAAAARTNVGRERALVLPDGASRTRIERERAIVSAGGVKNAVDDQRSGFKFSAGHGLVSPLGHEREGI